MRSLDLNCDLGEGVAAEGELMPLVTSANIACGGHTGDDKTMRRSVILAIDHGIAIGAHPSFVDSTGFGRQEQTVTPAGVQELIVTQTRSLQTIVDEERGALRHIKLHGALYNQTARDASLAQAVIKAIQLLDSQLILFAPAGSILEAMAVENRVPVACEAFADRTYQSDGSLTLRTHARALITDEGEAVAQVLRLVREGKILTVDGAEIALRVDTVCVHGDRPSALHLVRALRQALLAAHVSLEPPSR